MKLAELEKTLRNGFHDAILDAVTIDYTTRSAMFSMRVWVGLLEESVPGQGRLPVMRRCDVRVTDLAFCSIDPPTKVLSGDDGINITDGMTPDPVRSQFPSATEGRFLYAWYAGDWNGYIYVCGGDADLSWHESEERAWSTARSREVRS